MINWRLEKETRSEQRKNFRTEEVFGEGLNIILTGKEN